MKSMFVIEESHYQEPPLAWSDFTPLEGFCSQELAEEYRQKYKDVFGRIADFRVVLYVPKN